MQRTIVMLVGLALLVSAGLGFLIGRSAGGSDTGPTAIAMGELPTSVASPQAPAAPSPTATFAVPASPTLASTASPTPTSTRTPTATASVAESPTAEVDETPPASPASLNDLLLGMLTPSPAPTATVDAASSRGVTRLAEVTKVEAFGEEATPTATATPEVPTPAPMQLPPPPSTLPPTATPQPTETATPTREPAPRDDGGATPQSSDGTGIMDPKETPAS